MKKVIAFPIEKGSESSSLILPFEKRKRIFKEKKKKKGGNVGTNEQLRPHVLYKEMASLRSQPFPDSLTQQIDREKATSITFSQ